MSRFQSTALQTKLASLPVFDFSLCALKHNVQCYARLSLQCVETDETAKKPDLIKMPVNSEEEREAITHLEQAVSAPGGVTSGDERHYSHQAKVTAAVVALNISW